ncbi:MAG: ribosome small subunit-dependent GTPase A [Chlorobi bacterium]|nr:ribosome small subunit-dependent GTPase A [Chlorobiota bacterium]
MINGRIVKIEAKDYYVETDDGRIVRCNLPGRFKKQFHLKKDKLYKIDIAAVGDFLEIELNEDGTGTIQSIIERKNSIARKAPKIKGASRRGERLEQIVAANVDEIFIVSSVDEPPFNSKFIDRIIVAAESSHIRVNIIINKIDLDDDKYYLQWKELYEKIGYDVFPASAEEKAGLGNIEKRLGGKVNLFWGQSGVGKSSILNAIFPHFDLKVGDISGYSNKGQHTTVTSVMLKVAENTYVIDTPGIREMAPFGIMKIDLAHYFKEFEPFIQQCKFNTCTHYHEPECAVAKAVEKDLISVERYESYLNILETIEEDMNF